MSTKWPTLTGLAWLGSIWNNTPSRPPWNQCAISPRRKKVRWTVYTISLVWLLLSSRFPFLRTTPSRLSGTMSITKVSVMIIRIITKARIAKESSCVPITSTKIDYKTPVCRNMNDYRSVKDDGVIDYTYMRFEVNDEVTNQNLHRRNPLKGLLPGGFGLLGIWISVNFFFAPYQLLCTIDLFLF